jgi:hypothetical protein
MPPTDTNAFLAAKEKFRHGGSPSVKNPPEDRGSVVVVEPGPGPRSLAEKRSLSMQVEPWNAKAIRQYTEWIQRSLNDAIGAGLRVDGARGPETVAKIKEFQREHGLTADGRVGPLTEKRL